MIEHAAIIEWLEKLTEDFAEHVCVSFERLCLKKNVTRIKLSEYAISSEVWLRLLAYVICTNPEAWHVHRQSIQLRFPQSLSGVHVFLPTTIETDL